MYTIGANEQEVRLYDVNGFVDQPEVLIKIRPEAIPFPGLPPDPRSRFDEKKDPKWEIDGTYGRHQLVEPIYKTSIGSWCVEHNKPFIWQRGFMYKNPRILTDCTFDWDPHKDPYKVEEAEEGIVFTKPLSVSQSLTNGLA